MGTTSKIQELETQIEILKECIEDMEDNINKVKEDKEKVIIRIDAFRKWLLENQKKKIVSQKKEV